MSHIARIFEDVGGFYINDEQETLLRTDGKCYPTKKEALLTAYRSGYTHAVGSGTYYRNGVHSIASQIKTQ